MPDRELECRRLGTAIFLTQTKLVTGVLVFSREQKITNHAGNCQAERTRRINTPLA